jgi:hypothetical protein
MSCEEPVHFVKYYTDYRGSKHREDWRVHRIFGCPEVGRVTAHFSVDRADVTCVDCMKACDPLTDTKR